MHRSKPSIIRLLTAIILGHLSLQMSLCDTLQAGSISASLSPEKGTVGTQFELTLEIQGNLEEEINFPKIKGLSFLGRSHSTQVSYINGRQTRSLSITYSLGSDTPGLYEIPSISAMIDGELIYTQPQKLVVKKPDDHLDVEGSSLPGAFIQRNFSSQNPYAGEPVLQTTKLFFRIKVLDEHRASAKIADTRRIEAGKDMSQEVFGGTNYSVLSYYDVLIPQRSGEFEIPADTVQLEVLEQSRRRSRRDDLFGSFFGDSMGQRRAFALSSQEDRLKVRELPKLGQRKNFSGLVGSFKMRANLSSDSLKEGETTTLTVTIKGRGLLDSLSELNLALDPHIKVYPDKPQNTEKPSKQRGIESEKTFKYALVPNLAGTFKLNPLELLVFNPEKETYEVLKQELPDLVVDADPNKPKVKPEILGARIPTSAGQTQVESLGRDLSDIHRRGDGRRSQLDLLPWWAFVLFAGFGPGSFALSTLLTQKKGSKLQAKKKQRRRSQAFKRYKQARSSWQSQWSGKLDSKAAVEAYYTVFKAFFSDKLGLSGQAMTTKEISDSLEKMQIEPKLRDEAKKLLYDLDQVSFDSKQMNPDSGASLISRIENFVAELDSHAK